MAWVTKVTDAVQGLKTLLAAALFIVLGLADYFDAVPIQPLLNLMFGENVAAKLMVVLPIVFATLRFVTSGKVRWMRDNKEPS